MRFPRRTYFLGLCAFVTVLAAVPTARADSPPSGCGDGDGDASVWGAPCTLDDGLPGLCGATYCADGGPGVCYTCIAEAPVCCTPPDPGPPPEEEDAGPPPSPAVADAGVPDAAVVAAVDLDSGPSATSEPEATADAGGHDAAPLPAGGACSTSPFGRGESSAGALLGLGLAALVVRRRRCNAR